MDCLVSTNVILIFHFTFYQIFAANKEVTVFSQLSNCKSNEYFDSTSFSCMQCDTNKNLVPATDRLRCICNKFSKQIGLRNDYPICVSCGSNGMVTTDERDCISCNNALCDCNINEIQIDRGIDGTLLNAMYCLPCPNNTYPSLDKSKCLSCNSLKYDYYVTYINSKYYTWIQDQCLYRSAFPNELHTNITNLIKFKNQTMDDHNFKNELKAALYFCKRKHRSACEYLSNVCILSFYTNKIACELFAQMQTASVWSVYSKNETTTVLNSKKITQKYSLLKSNNNSTLNFKVATFSLHGNFKSIDTPNMPCNLLENIRFGVNCKKKCKFRIKDLLSAEIEFMSPYLTFMENRKVLMHALPVLIKNMNQNNNDISQWQLVRKFFLVDNISGYKTSLNLTNKENINRINKLSTLSYMKSLSVIVNVQSTEDSDKIFPPLLVVEYTELLAQQISETADVILNYEIKFTLTGNNINVIFEIIVGVFSGVALICSAIKTWNYNKQHRTSSSYTILLVWFFIYTMGAVGTVIIVTLISLCIYLFIFYKEQTIPYILFSDDINENIIKVFTTIAFLFKLAEMLGFICQYWKLNIFFIDWEQPKALCNPFSLCKLHSNKWSKQKYKPLHISTETIMAKRKKVVNKSDECNSSMNTEETNFSAIYSIPESSIQEVHKRHNVHTFPVSIWRTCHIANHWLHLQTIRKINVMVQLVAVLIIFQIIQQYPWILIIPEIPSNFSKDNDNFILYYTVCILVYVLIYSIQWLLFGVLYERCNTNKMQEFINLCSTVNISIFILPYNYYGFYIHGRSVHGISDTDLPTLINNLEKERNNLCACKGLVPGTNQQTFILSLTKTFRIILTEFSNQSKISSSKFLRTNHFTNINWEQIFNTQIKLKQFLCKFVDHCFEDMDYIVKDQQFFEKLFNIMFFHNEEKSVFYIDNNHSFDQVLFYGNEWLIATFEFSIFAFMIVLFRDCVLAITVTVSVSMLLLLIAKHNGKKNLSDNVLSDKTFLI